MVEEELARLGEQRVSSSEGTVAVALELCREFEDRFLQHINTGEVSVSVSLALTFWCQDVLTYILVSTHDLKSDL